MLLPDRYQVDTLDWAKDAQPFVFLSVTDKIDTQNMDIIKDAQPFVANPSVDGVDITGHFFVIV